MFQKIFFFLFQAISVVVLALKLDKGLPIEVGSVDESATMKTLGLIVE